MSQGPINKKRIFAAVLAAGMASRFGSSKLLAEYDGLTLVRRAANTAAEACGARTLLVVGHDWRAVAAACEPLRGFMAINDNYADGLGTSVASATRALQHVADAVIVMLADQPLISAEHLRDLCNTWSGGANEIVATSYAGTVGVPALFGSACFSELANLSGDTGARRLITSGRFPLRRITFEAAATDIDTPADLENLV